MKTNLKKRLAVFLSILMVLPAIVAVLPMTATEVSAASYVYVGWYYFPNSGKDTIQVEKGEEFNIGDYVSISDGDFGGLASMLDKVSYSSSNKSVITVTSKGVFTAKNTGTSVITVKYKKKKATCKFQVVKDGTFEDSIAVQKLNEVAEPLAKDMPKKITVSNGYALLQMRNDFRDVQNKYYSEISDSGLIREMVKTSGGYSYATNTCKLAVPKAGRYLYLDNMLWNYVGENSVTATRSSKGMKIASISANTKQITVKTKKPISAENMLAANIGSYQGEINKKKLETSVGYIEDVTDKKTYIMYATLVKGSKTVKIRVGTYEYKNGSSKFVAKKLKKGHTYSLGNRLTWAKGKTVKVK